MLARYRVVVVIYVLALLNAAFVADNGYRGFAWEFFWRTFLIMGTGISGLWLMICWVISPFLPKPKIVSKGHPGS